LRQAGKKHAFQVTDMPTFNLEGDRVSSTRIREALSRGALDIATRLLGRPYSLCGRVAHGDKRGRTLGFPTANIHLHRRFSPLQGVFAVNMHGLDGRPVPGVANLGTRPTVNGPPRLLLEVHLFDFSGEIYGRYIEVEFVAQLREERRFPSFEALKQQIAQDLLAAREIFTNP
jgi:riboflavin kinase/FMN adenylyltransferase